MHELLVLTLALSRGASLAPDAPAQQARLNAAIASFDQLNPAKSRKPFDDLIASVPSDRIAAQAYLYLGILDFNELDRSHANQELQRALELDPTVDMPPGISPKIELAFEEMRRKLSVRLHEASKAAPAEAVGAGTVVEVAPPPRTRVLPWVFGGAAVMALAGSAWGWAEVASFEHLKSSSSSASPVTPAAAQSAQNLAVVGEVVGIAAAIGAAGLATGAIVTW